MNRFIHILSSLLIVAMAVSLTACGDDNDEPKEELSKSNAKGVCIMYDTDALDIDNVYLWINDYGIYTMDFGDTSELNLKYSTNEGINYYPLTMNVVYELLSEDFGTEVNAETDFSSFIPNPTKLINHIRSNKSKYKYIASRYGDFILFNRTSNENFY